MKRQELYFDSRDNESRIHAVRYTPDDGQVHCVVQIIHGMAEYVERYEEFALFLTKRGCLVTGENHLGHGKTVEKDGTYGYFCHQDPATVVVRDVHRLKKITQELYPSVPYIMLGHSMGSFILRNYLSRYGSGIDGAIIMGSGELPPALLGASKLLASILKLFRGERCVSRFLDKAAFGGYNKKIENAATPFDWLSKDKVRVDKYLADPLCGFIFTINGFQTLFELISRAQEEERIKDIPARLPILLTAGKEDPVGDYGAGVQKIFEKLTKAGLLAVQCRLYDNDRHELLNETNAEEVMQDIYDWILPILQTGRK